MQLFGQRNRAIQFIFSHDEHCFDFLTPSRFVQFLQFEMISYQFLKMFLIEIFLRLLENHDGYCPSSISKSQIKNTTDYSFIFSPN